MSCVRCVLTEKTKRVIHIDSESPRDGDAFALGDFYGFFKGMVHPDFGYDDHETQADRARIHGCVMNVVVDEIRCGEA